MSNFGITYDTSEIYNILNNLNDTEVKRLLMTALKEGGKTLQELTKQSLTNKVAGATRTGGKTAFKNKQMTKGVKVISDTNYTEVIVSIMGDSRLIWEELGTDDRTLKGKQVDNGSKYAKRYKEGVSRGKIEPTRFFQDARQSPETQNMVEQVLKQELEKALNK